MDFKCTNKDCKKYDKIDQYYKIRTFYNEGKTVYKDKRGQQIICPKCKKPLEFIPEEKSGFPSIVIGSFNSMTNNEKRSALVKREREHTKRDKNFAEEKKFREEQIINKKL